MYGCDPFLSWCQLNKISNKKRHYQAPSSRPYHLPPRKKKRTTTNYKTSTPPIPVPPPTSIQKTIPLKTHAMHFSNVLILLLSCLVLGVAANPIAPASGISSQLVQPRDEAGPLEAMIYARATKKGSKSISKGNSTSTTTSSASGPLIVGGYAPLVLGMGMVAVLGLNVL